MSKYRPKCFCTATLRPDGICPEKCDPALRGPRKRAKKLNAILRKQSRTSTVIGLPQELMSEKARKALPDYGRVGMFGLAQEKRARRRR